MGKKDISLLEIFMLKTIKILFTVSQAYRHIFSAFFLDLFLQGSVSWRCIYYILIMVSPPPAPSRSAPTQLHTLCLSLDSNRQTHATKQTNNNNNKNQANHNWEKFSISNNRALDKPYWLRYCHCTKLQIIIKNKQKTTSKWP